MKGQKQKEPSCVSLLIMTNFETEPIDFFFLILGRMVRDRRARAHGASWRVIVEHRTKRDDRALEMWSR